MNLLRPSEALLEFQVAVSRIEDGYCNLEAKKQEIFITEAKKRLIEAEAASKKKKGIFSIFFV